MMVAMRGLLAFFLIASLLIVSSVPMLAEAAGCSVPAHQAAMHALTSGVPGHAHIHVPAAFRVHRKLTANAAGDTHPCCIECGCGCHHNIDALPHLLAPHAVQLSESVIDVVSLAAGSAAAPVWLAVVAPVYTPPPQYL